MEVNFFLQITSEGCRIPERSSLPRLLQAVIQGHQDANPSFKRLRKGR